MARTRSRQIEPVDLLENVRGFARHHPSAEYPNPPQRLHLRVPTDPNLKNSLSLGARPVASAGPSFYYFARIDPTLQEITMKASPSLIAVLAACLTPLAASPGDKDPILIVDVVELSGTGASTGANMKNGAELAAKEINAAGGILGRPVSMTSLDSQTNPGVAKAMTQKAIDMGAYAVIGPVFSGSAIVSMTETRRAEIPNFVGSEATSITAQGNPYVFRTSITLKTSMPKLVRYIKDSMHSKTIAMIWGNDELGKSGRDEAMKWFKASGISVVADIPTDPGQIDFAGAALKAKESNADALFLYVHEEESARALRELRKQGYDKPIVGETTLLSQKTIELAGDAANGVRGHVGLTVDAPLPAIRAFDANFTKTYGYRSDHNGLKGYLAMYMVKLVTEKVGKVDPKAFAKAMKGVSFQAKDHPGLIMDVHYDDVGDLDCETFIVEVKNGKQAIVATLPPLAI